MSSRAPTTDRNGRPVSLGTRVRLVEIPPSLKSTLPDHEWNELQQMLGQVLTVSEIDEAGYVWVEKWWTLPGEESFCHSLQVDSHEMEVVDAEPSN